MYTSGRTSNLLMGFPRFETTMPPSSKPLTRRALASQCLRHLAHFALSLALALTLAFVLPVSVTREWRCTRIPSHLILIFIFIHTFFLPHLLETSSPPLQHCLISALSVSTYFQHNSCQRLIFQPSNISFGSYSAFLDFKAHMFSLTYHSCLPIKCLG